MYKNKQSPWGKIQNCFQITPWLSSVNTSSHGGLKLDRYHNGLIPTYARRSGGWYEEDCEWSIVFCVLEESINQCLTAKAEDMPFIRASLESARKTLANWYPDIYEGFYKTILQPGESNAKDQRAWNEAHKDNYKLYCAMNEGLGNNVKVLLQKSLDQLPEEWFLISKDLYNERRTKFGWAFTPEEVKHFYKRSAP